MILFGWLLQRESTAQAARVDAFWWGAEVERAKWQPRYVKGECTTEVPLLTGTKPYPRLDKPSTSE